MLRSLPILVPTALAGLLLACAGDRVPSDGPGVPAPALVESAATMDSTRMAFDRIMAFARDSALAEEQDFGMIIQAVGRQLMGAPYVAGMLDASEDETLIADLTAFDCVLYVENVLALARGIAVGDTTFEGYVRQVESLRYRDGEMRGYCSRLHYFTEWIHDNEERGVVEDVTREAGGVRYEKEIDFMSTHRESYPRMTSDDTYQCIVEMERDLRGHELFYIPKAEIAEHYDSLRPGDVIATATNIDGLDVTHTGFVYRTGDGRTAFLNASLSGEVLIAPDLASYVQGVRAQTGIIVARPVDPRGQLDGDS
jgi:hypothetical protein